MNYLTNTLKHKFNNIFYKMESFAENLSTISENLLKNLSKFMNKNNHSAGTKARKNAQELKTLLQELRVEILDTQKERKEKKAAEKSAASSS